MLFITNVCQVTGMPVIKGILSRDEPHNDSFTHIQIPNYLSDVVKRPLLS